MPIQLDHHRGAVFEARQIPDLSLVDLGHFLDPPTTAGTLQFAVPALAAYPQTQSLSFFVDLAAIDPIPGPSQNPCPLALAHPAERTEKSLPRKPPLIEQSFRFLRRAQITYDPATEISEEFKDQGEHYYGIWEYPFGGNIENRGADHDFIGLGAERHVHHASARALFYMTSRGYGIYVESLALGHFSIAQAGRTSFSFKDSHLTYDVIYGPSYSEVMNRYNAIASPAIMPPLWAFGTIWWRDDEHDDLRDVANAQDKVIQDADRLRALKIPAAASWLDRPYGSGDKGWGNMDFDSSFPDPPKMIRDLNDRGMKLLLWSANRASSGLFREGSQKGYLYSAYWPTAEVQRPEVYAWFKEKLSAYVRLAAISHAESQKRGERQKRLLLDAQSSHN